MTPSQASFSDADAVDSYPPTALARSERNRLWGYPDIYRQLTEEVLPAMQAVDELRSRHVQQQAVDSSQLQVGLGPPNITFSPPTDTTVVADVGGQGEDGIDVQAPLALGTVAEVNRSMNLASLDMPVEKEPLYQKPTQISSSVEPTGVEWNQGVVTTPMQQPGVFGERTCDQRSGESSGKKG